MDNGGEKGEKFNFIIIMQMVLQLSSLLMHMLITLCHGTCPTSGFLIHNRFKNAYMRTPLLPCSIINNMLCELFYDL